MPWLFILFVVVPAVEIYLLIQLGQLIGGLQTLGIVLATGLLGSYLAKSQGLAVWNKLSTKLGSGQMPGTELVDGAIILISGTLLITPGVLTDVVGLLGLLPFTRGLFRSVLSAFFKNNVKVVGFGVPQYDQNRTETNQKPNPSATVELSGVAKQRPSNRPDDLK